MVNFPSAGDNRSHGSANVDFPTQSDLKKALEFNEEVRVLCAVCCVLVCAGSALSSYYVSLMYRSQMLAERPVRMDLQPYKGRSERNQGFGASLTGSWSDAVNGLILHRHAHPL